MARDAASSPSIEEECPPQLIHSKPRNGRDPERKRHGARNQHKMKHFVRWLLDTFPASSSSNETTTHILDIAGGKGELAARLCLCHQKRVILVDPRPASVALCFETTVLPKLPAKWRDRFVAQQQKARADSTKSNNSSYNSNTRMIEELLNDRGYQQIVTHFTTESLQADIRLQQAVANASLLVGMHADAATEAVVDAALAYRKPFVVVPCCVFPNLFVDRRIIVGAADNAAAVIVRPVRSYEDFCEYLLQKDARFQKTVLPFEGRNVAIWWDGRDEIEDY
jgi:hypothetical protein